MHDEVCVVDLYTCRRGAKRGSGHCKVCMSSHPSLVPSLPRRDVMFCLLHV